MTIKPGLFETKIRSRLEDETLDELYFLKTYFKIINDVMLLIFGV